MPLRLLGAFLLDQRDGRLRSDGCRVERLGDGDEGAVVANEGAEPPHGGHHLLALILAHHARQLEELQGLLQRDRLDRLRLHQRCEARLGGRLVLLVHHPDLRHRAVTPNLDRDGQATLRIRPQQPLPCPVALARGQRLLHHRVEELVESIHRLSPDQLALGNGIKVLLHIGREVIIDHLRERFRQEVIHHRAHVRGEQFVPISPHHLALLALRDLPVAEGQDAIPSLLARLVATHHILPVLNRLDRRGIRRGSPNAELFHAVY